MRRLGDSEAVLEIGAAQLDEGCQIHLLFAESAGVDAQVQIVQMGADRVDVDT